MREFLLDFIQILLILIVLLFFIFAIAHGAIVLRAHLGCGLVMIGTAIVMLALLVALVVMLS